MSLGVFFKNTKVSNYFKLLCDWNLFLSNSKLNRDLKIPSNKIQPAPNFTQNRAFPRHNVQKNIKTLRSQYVRYHRQFFHRFELLPSLAKKHFYYLKKNHEICKITIKILACVSGRIYYTSFTRSLEKIACIFFQMLQPTS